MFRKKIFFSILLGFCLGSGYLHTAAGDIALPDGSKFAYWRDQTEYSRVYHVSQAHPEASDENSGTRSRPFRTINHAAQVVRPGEKVVVHSGVYREKIAPKHGGLSSRAMVCYTAAPGEHVVVKGSVVLNADWEMSADPKSQKDLRVRSYSHKLWQTTLPQDVFPNNCNPFLIPNASDEEIHAMHWAHQWKGRIPYTLGRGLVFQNGRRLTQMGIYEDLTSFQGTYWVDTENAVLHVHPFGSYQPDSSIFEVTVHQQLFKPETMGVGYIKLQGFIFEHAANGFPRIGTGAVYVNNGHHWIIQNNVVRQVNSVGIETGARTAEYRSLDDSGAERRRSRDHKGGFMIRDNEVYECGTGGIQGHTVRHSLLENNHIHHIGWQDVERYWECAGVKWLRSEHNLIINNYVHDIESACAIWLDWDNRNSRVTRNVIHDIAPCYNGAVFIEASKVPNWVDHNIIWNADCIAISLFDTDNARVMHNLIGESRNPVTAMINTDRSLDGEPLTSLDNLIRNNIFYNVRELPMIKNPQNICDRNIYVDHKGRLDLDRWFEQWECGGSVEQFELQLLPCTLELIWMADVPLPGVPIESGMSMDMTNSERQHPTTAGPFQIKVNERVKFLLNDILELTE
ncbi:MAG: right-handed parallel beta-helix repeat-containing protein [candidate division KSB1 bacterium]|nr:right-handed parallel beta-helix repeat-containing protein [candidate division KSB1 bacterium]